MNKFKPDVEKALIFLMGNPRTKTELAKFVYRRASKSNLSRLNRDIIAPHKDFFIVMDGLQAYSAGLGLYGKNHPDPRIRVVSLNWECLLALWEDEIVNYIYPAEIKAVLKSEHNIEDKIKEMKAHLLQVEEILEDRTNQKFLFDFQTLEKLFMIDDKWCFPSPLGLINIMLFYTQCFGKSYADITTPFHRERELEVSNIRGLFKIYYLERIEKFFSNKFFRELKNDISLREEQFLKDRIELKEAVYGNWWIKRESSLCNEDFQLNLNKLSEQDVRNRLFLMRIANVIYNNFIFLIEPRVIRDGKHTGGFYNLLYGGIAVKLPYGYLDGKVEKTKEKIERENSYSQIMFKIRLESLCKKKKMSIKKVKIKINGFDERTYTEAKKLTDLGVKVVAVGDRFDYIYNSGGINITSLFDFKKRNKTIKGFRQAVAINKDKFEKVKYYFVLNGYLDFGDAPVEVNFTFDEFLPVLESLFYFRRFFD